MVSKHRQPVANTQMKSSAPLLQHKMKTHMIFMVDVCLLAPPHLPSLCQQDTTDYVAYVAKDPVNRRGKVLLNIQSPLLFENIRCSDSH